MEQRTIKFDANQHKYTDEFGNTYVSVTQLIGQFTPQFDERYWLMYKALEKKYKVKPDVKNNIILVDGTPFKLDELYDESSHKTSGIQQVCSSIKNEWIHKTQVAIDKGNETHEYMETCIKQFSKAADVDISKFSKTLDSSFKLKITSMEELENSPLRYSHESIYRKLAYFVSQGFVIYAEKRVYSPLHLIAGTIDVFVIRGKEFYILDWKTNKKPLKFEAGYFKKKWVGNEKIETDEWIHTNEKLLPPLSSIANCKGGVYTIQLGTYAYICELWGLTCLGLELYQIIEGQEPKRFEIPYRKLDIQYMFEYRYKEVKNGYTAHVLSSSSINIKKSAFGIQ